MKVLLDTHTFLWAIAEDGKLSRRAQQIYTGPNDLWLSVASVWEILIKVRAGQLPLPKPSGPHLLKELAKNRIEVLPIALDHVLGAESLPLHVLIACSLRRASKRDGQSSPPILSSSAILLM
jgi:PIN domain nuclease of toxin-antitoxin system